MVFQQYTKSIFPWRTVRENVEFGLRAQKTVSRAQARERCNQYISLVGLETYEDYYPISSPAACAARLHRARPHRGARRAAEWMSPSRRSTP